MSGLSQIAVDSAHEWGWQLDLVNVSVLPIQWITSGILQGPTPAYTTGGVQSGSSAHLFANGI